MNIEFEVKNILREGISPEEKAIKIMEFSTFKKDDIINAIKKGGFTISDIYGNLIR
jgi:hypothetical protein